MQLPQQFLRQYYGYSTFRPQQEQIINAILQNQDVLVLMPTGGGKSICYQIPALIKDGITLVISPLIALMKDQVQALKANGISAEFINSSLNPVEEALIITRCIEHKIKLLYLSPEKILTLSEEILKLMRIALFAIDEAHCISQWGHDFRPEYAQLKMLRELFPEIPIVALTATADKITRKDILSKLELKTPQVFITSFDRPNLNLSVRSNVKDREKIEEITSFIKSKPDQSGIIYCLSRKSTETIHASLTEAGIKSAFYHAGMDSSERSKVQEEFTLDNIKIICATIAFGMGIDKSNVRWIIHYNLPKNIEGYYQEIGRCGRDNAPAEAILYYNIKDLIMLNKFAVQSGQPELNLEKLKRMQQYAEAKTCRRKILLSYFGENFDRNCNHCDVCKDPPKYINGTLIAQKAISALLRANESIGIAMLIDILRGSLNAEVIAKGFDKLKTHGAGREFSNEVWQSYILQLLQIGIFEMAYDEGFVLKVSDYGKHVVKGNQNIELVGPTFARIKEPDQSQEISKTDDQLLFDALRKLRKQIADREGLPPYIVFHDSTLMQMVDMLPTNRLEMMLINGMSFSKYERFGFLFEQRIAELSVGMKRKGIFDIEKELTHDNITRYIDELKKYSVQISPSIIVKLLLGSEKDMIANDLKQLSYYGSLKGKANHKILKPIIHSYFKTNNDSMYTQRELTIMNFFSEPLKNELLAEEIEEAKFKISEFAINRPNESIDNDYILNTRKHFRRAYEYWNQEESELLLALSKKTNDLDLLASIFLRNPVSLKTQYKKLHKMADPLE
jgi:ATP-dependent DNA helicase RecQ